MTPKLVVLSAPSGGGKTTITQRLLAQRNDVGYSVSATTRSPRAGEADGKAYRFLSREQFDALEREGAFLETAEYAGARYGTLQSEVDRVLDAGRHVVLDIEIAGARRVRERYPWPESVEIFVLPPSAEVLLERLRGRHTESDDAIAPRVAQAIRELEEAPGFDYRVVNDNLDEAVARVSALIDNTRRPPAVKPAERKAIAAIVAGLQRFTHNVRR